MDLLNQREMKQDMHDWCGTQTLITNCLDAIWCKDQEKKLRNSEKSLPIFASVTWGIPSRCQQKIHVCIPGSSSTSSHYLLCANNKDGCQAKLQMNTISLHKHLLPRAMVSIWWTLRKQANIHTTEPHISAE